MLLCWLWENKNSVNTSWLTLHAGDYLVAPLCTQHSACHTKNTTFTRLQTETGNLALKSGLNWTHLTRDDWDASQVQFLCVAAESCGVPVHLVLCAAALLQLSGAVDKRHRLPPTVLQAPTAGLPPFHHCGVPTPVIWGEALEDDANIHTCKRKWHNTEEGKNAFLTVAESPHVLQQVVKGCHLCRALEFLNK